MATMINTEELVTSVADDRLVKVIVGSDEEQQTFMLQDTLLRRTSRVFSANLNHEHLGEEDKGVLRFPADDVAAWKVLVFWAFTQKLPEEDLETLGSAKQQALLVQCWILGDVYEVAEFQDLAMLELLQVLNTKYMAPETAEAAALATMPGCKLRLLAAREVVTSFRAGQKSTLDFNDAFTVNGFAAEIINEMQTREANVSKGMRGGMSIGAKDGKGRSREWKKFVLVSPPYKHWIHKDNSDAA